MPVSLQNKVVVVIGASSGIGRATAIAAAREGAQVVLAARNQERLAEVAKEIGANANIEKVDIAHEGAVRALFEAVGNFDHLVATAADLSYGPFLDLDIPAARKTFETKLWGYWYCARYGGPRISKDGSITFFSGLAAEKPGIGTAAVSVVNGAVTALGLSLAIELAPVRVNVVSPGIVDTPTWSGMPDEQRRRFFDNTASKLPARRIGQPEDLAQAALFLMTNPFTTGTVLHVNGGAMLS